MHHNSTGIKFVVKSALILSVVVAVNAYIAFLFHKELCITNLHLNEQLFLFSLASWWVIAFSLNYLFKDMQSFAHVNYPNDQCRLTNAYITLQNFSADRL